MDIQTIVSWGTIVSWVIFVIRWIFSKLKTLERGKSSMFKIISSNKISALCILSAVIFSGYSLYLHYTNKESVHWSKKQLSLKEISHRTFINEKVPLDGIHYTHCKFENVAFIYNGTAPTSLDHADLYGKITILSDNDGIFQTFVIMKGLGVLKSDIPVTIGPEYDEVQIKEPAIKPWNPKR